MQGDKEHRLLDAPRLWSWATSSAWASSCCPHRSRLRLHRARRLGITVLGMAVLAGSSQARPRVSAGRWSLRVHPRERGRCARVPGDLVLLGVALGDQSAALAIGVVGYLTAVVPSLQGVSPALLALGMIWLFVAICLFGRARAAACRS